MLYKVGLLFWLCLIFKVKAKILNMIDLLGGMQNFVMNADSAALFQSAQILQETPSFFFLKNL